MPRVQLHIRMKKTKEKAPAALAPAPVSDELPPSYDEALMLPDSVDPSPPATQPTTHSPAAPENPRDPPSAARERLTMRSLESELLRSNTLVVRHTNRIQEEIEPLQAGGDDDGDDDGKEVAYSDDDLAFEAYEDDGHTQQQQPLCQDSDGDPLQLLNECNASFVPTSTAASTASATSAPVDDTGHPADNSPQQCSVAAACEDMSCSHRPRRSDPGVATCVYDDNTYTIVSRLRAANKSLAAQLEKQMRVVGHLQGEKKQHLELIRTLRADLQMHKQTLRGVHMHGRRLHTSDDTPIVAVAQHRLPSSLQPSTSPTHPILPHVVGAKDTVSPRGDYRLLMPSSSSVSDCTLESASDGSRHAAVPSKTPVSPRLPPHPAASPLFKRPGAGFNRQQSPAAIHAGCCSNNNSNSSQALQQLVEKYAAKLEKAEQDKKELLARHGHQVANYSHELSRLERQLDHAHKLALDKENELRLQKTKLLYTHRGVGGTSSSSARHDGSQLRGLLADDFWRNLAPPGVGGVRAPAPAHSTHIGLAFEQLLAHHTVSLHEHSLDTSTRDWLRELRVCGAQMLALHRSFQSMSCAFQRLAESSHMYQLAETLARESRELLRAEQALVFVVDTAEHEFWCRVPRATGAKDMITVRSRMMPFATAGHTPGGASRESHALHTGAASHLSASGLPSGLASMVYHTQRPLLLNAGCVTKHPCYSTASDNTDRLITHASASTLLLPILRHGHVLGVLQLCGKTTVVEALGLSVALKTSDAFTAEDQALVLLLVHFASGLFPKVAYFTEVESNKVNEETLIQLAPEIFTCLRFEELGKIVIENAKEILDADRCSLFVANTAERTLHNWQSDISGGTVQVYDNRTKSGSGGMTIPFGHGIVGLVAETRQCINIPDAYDDPRFNASWDKKTNYRTKSMLAVPILKNTTKRQPIRRASRVHSGDKFATVAAHGPHHQRHHHPVQSAVGDAAATVSTDSSTSSELLGVVQVINKSGGAPFRAKDEFLLQTITKLIALAIENSQLFQKNQELCADLGTLIGNADLVDATSRLGAAAEDIIGVESAAIYVYDHLAQEMVTFHRKRRHRIVVKEQMYRSTLFGIAVQTKDVVIVNDVSDAPGFNAYVDSIGGAAVRNVLFAPLVVDDPDAALGNSGSNATKLVGLLHLVNTRGRKVVFERHDLFLSIISSMCCSVIASILEKQVLLKQQDQTRLLLDTSMSFFKEMSPIGVINAVYNACASIFSVEKAHLFLWEPDRRHMWTSKLLPYADAGSSSTNGLTSSLPSPTGSSSNGSTTAVSSLCGGAIGTDGTGAGSAAGNQIPTLGAQLRRISVLTDQKLKAPTTEGLLEQVLVKGTVLLVKHWVNSAEAEKEREAAGVDTTTALPLRKYALRSSASDEKLGFVKHAVVACPVWDNYGLEIVGVLVLLFPRGRAPPLSELSNLPILCRQIAGALNVCSDLSAVTARSRKLQGILELSMRKPTLAASLTLSARGQLVTFSQPVNVDSPGFHAGELAASVHAASALNLGVCTLPMDEEGHRWGFQLSAAAMHEMHSEHFVTWIGKDVRAAPPSLFDKLRTDLQSVYVRKESMHGEIVCSAVSSTGAHASEPADTSSVKTTALLQALPKHVVLEVRKLLWDFVDSAWRVDVKRACELFDCVDPSRQRCVSRTHLEHVLTTGGRAVRLNQLDWDLLHALFADPSTDLVHVEYMFETLAPHVRVAPRVAYELAPVLDPITQTVVSVHVVLTAL